MAMVVRSRRMRGDSSREARCRMVAHAHARGAAALLLRVLSHSSQSCDGPVHNLSSTGAHRAWRGGPASFPASTSQITMLATRCHLHCVALIACARSRRLLGDLCSLLISVAARHRAVCSRTVHWCSTRGTRSVCLCSLDIDLGLPRWYSSSHVSTVSAHFAEIP